MACVVRFQDPFPTDFVQHAMMIMRPATFQTWFGIHFRSLSNLSVQAVAEIVVSSGGGGGGPTFWRSPSPAAFAEDEWILVVATRESVAAGGRGECNIYNLDTGVIQYFKTATAVRQAWHPEPEESQVIFGYGTSFPSPTGHLFGDLQLAAAWKRAISLGEQLQLLISQARWLSLGPEGMWRFDQENVAVPVVDLRDGAHQVARVGTAVVAEDGPIPIDDPPPAAEGTYWVPGRGHIAPRLHESPGLIVR